MARVLATEAAAAAARSLRREWVTWGGENTQRRPRVTATAIFNLEGADRELRKSEDATHFATDGPAPRR